MPSTFQTEDSAKVSKSLCQLLRFYGRFSVKLKIVSCIKVTTALGAFSRDCHRTSLWCFANKTLNPKPLNRHGRPWSKGCKPSPPRNRSFLNDVAIQTRALPCQLVASTLTADTWETEVRETLISALVKNCSAEFDVKHSRRPVKFDMKLRETV